MVSIKQGRYWLLNEIRIITSRLPTSVGKILPMVRYDDQTNQIKTITLQTKLCLVIIKEVKRQHHTSQQFFCMSG